MTQRTSLLCILSLSGACRAYKDDFLFPDGVDADGDGYYVNAAALDSEAGDADCDDTNPAIHPAATEVCHTGEDDDCAFSESCYRWDSGQLNLAGQDGHQWQSETDNCELGYAVAGMSVEDTPVAAVSAPCAHDPGVVYLIPGSEVMGKSSLAGGISTMGQVTAAEEGDRLGEALLSEVSLGVGGSYLVMGAPGWSDGGAVFAVESGALRLGETRTLSKDDLLFEGDADTLVGTVMTWSGGFGADDTSTTLFLGAPDSEAVVFLACTAGGLALSCETATLPGADNSRFGSALAVLSGASDSWLAVGVPEASADAGEVQLFGEDTLASLQANGTPEPVLTIAGGVGFGAALAVADLWSEDSDVAGQTDGTLDLLVGVPAEDAVYIFDGKTLTQSAARGDTDWTAEDYAAVLHGASGSDFGATLFASSTIDADETPDLLVGAPLAGAAEGEVWVFLSSTGLIYGGDDPDLSAAPRLRGSVADGEAGFSVAAVSSLDSDPYPDLLIGAPYQSDIITNAGALYIVKGLGE